MIQVKIFDEYDNDWELNMNEFIKNKQVIDIKMNTVYSSAVNRFFTRCLVIYEEGATE